MKKMNSAFRCLSLICLCLFCALALSSCQTAGSLIDYLVSLPGNLFNAVMP